MAKLTRGVDPRISSRGAGDLDLAAFQGAGATRLRMRCSSMDKRRMNQQDAGP
jgi:hypothetical protein